MNKRYSVLLISIILLVAIVIIECFTEDEDKIVSLPVKNVINYEFEDSDTKININLIQIDSKHMGAKNINTEIKNLFELKANEIINDSANYVGTYQLASEYSYLNGILSIKIYEKDSNDEGTSGNIYSVIYDTKNDLELNISSACNLLKLNYNEIINKAKEYSFNKNKYINCEVPYAYINDKGNLELILRSIIQVDKYSFWNNIEIYEVDTTLNNGNK